MPRLALLPSKFPTGLALPGAHGGSRLPRMRDSREVRSPSATAPLPRAGTAPYVAAGPRLGRPGGTWDAGRCPRPRRDPGSAGTTETVAGSPADRPQIVTGRRARRRAALRRARGWRARSTSSTSTRPSRRRRRTCTRRASTGRPDGRKLRALAYDDQLGRGGVGGVPRHARAAPRGAGAPARRPTGRSGCTSTGARRTSCALLLDEILGRRGVRQRDRLAARAEPGSPGGEPPVRAHARHARRLRRTGGEARAAHAARADRRRRRSAGRRGAPVHQPRRAATTPTHRSRASTPKGACTGRRAARSTSSTSS